MDIFIFSFYSEELNKPEYWFGTNYPHQENFLAQKVYKYPVSATVIVCVYVCAYNTLCKLFW